MRKRGSASSPASEICFGRYSLAACGFTETRNGCCRLSAAFRREQNMINVAIILGLLVTPRIVAHFCHFNSTIGGRIGIGAVFLFTALGHFVKTEAMLSMLP